MVLMTQQHNVFISVHKATQLRMYVVVERLNQLQKVLSEQPEWTVSHTYSRYPQSRRKMVLNMTSDNTQC